MKKYCQITRTRFVLCDCTSCHLKQNSGLFAFDEQIAQLNFLEDVIIGCLANNLTSVSPSANNCKYESIKIFEILLKSHGVPFLLTNFVGWIFFDVNVFFVSQKDVSVFVAREQQFQTEQVAFSLCIFQFTDQMVFVVHMFPFLFPFALFHQFW